MAKSYIADVYNPVLQPAKAGKTIMSRLSCTAAILLTALSASAVKADVQLRERGSVAYLTSHRIQPGDARTLRAFLDRPRAHPLRIIYLNSRGGRTIVALRMGQMIREHGLDTAYHVGRAKCASECTTVFAGGVNRYYIGGGGVRDGIGTRYGLGFHPSNGGFRMEDRVNEYYERMGTPGAADLRYSLYSRETADHLGHRDMFFASGRRAVRAGVATSLSAPRDPRLRD